MWKEGIDIMDTSKENVKMFAKATEIQALRGEGLWQSGDFYTDDVLKRPTVPVDFGVFVEGEDEPYEMYHPVWLPLQHQLQEMLMSSCTLGYLIAESGEVLEVVGKTNSRGLDSSNPETFCTDNNDLLYSFYGWYFNSDISRYNTMEQLWLAFVMKTMYNKIWDGNEWIKE